MNEFEVLLEPRAWRAAKRKDPESGTAFSAVKAAFWKRNLGWGQNLLHLPESPEPMPLSNEVAKRVTATSTIAKPMREGDPEKDYDVGLLGVMEQKTPQFNLRNVPRHVPDTDPDDPGWRRAELPDRVAYRKDLEEVRSLRYEPLKLTMADYTGDFIFSVHTENRRVFREYDWEQWLGREHKSNASGRLWTHVPADGGKRTRPWPKIRLIEHKFWKGRYITEQY